MRKNPLFRLLALASLGVACAPYYRTAPGTIGREPLPLAAPEWGPDGVAKIIKALQSDKKD